MTVSRDDEWIQVAALYERDEIVLAPGFLKVMGELGWEAKAFVGHLLGNPAPGPADPDIHRV